MERNKTIIVNEQHRELVRVIANAENSEFTFSRGADSNKYVANSYINTMYVHIVARGEGVTMEDAARRCVDEIRRQAYRTLMRLWEES